MTIKVFKYLSPVLIYVGAYFSFTRTGVFTYFPIIYAFAIIPLIELFLQSDPVNMSAAEEEIAKHNRWYDYMLYLMVPLQYAALVFFLFSITQVGISIVDMLGRTLTMGLLCGTFGINTAHELGHRKNKAEQAMAKMLLATSLYMHFFIEHNKGHHKHVATPQDPSSARRAEPVYLFYFRTIIYSYISAWRIANDETRKAGRKIYSLYNDMLRAQLWQLLLVASIFFIWGIAATLLFFAAAFLGALLLETVNYIEHYGLQRKETGDGKYERALAIHSWNSSHPLGRIMLFELSRHSDHHYMASRKYQILRHHEEAPQLPTGYPGSMLLSLLPPLWFKIMHNKIDNLQKENAHKS